MKKNSIYYLHATLIPLEKKISKQRKTEKKSTQVSIAKSLNPTSLTAVKKFQSNNNQMFNI